MFWSGVQSQSQPGVFQGCSKVEIETEPQGLGFTSGSDATDVLYVSLFQLSSQ